MAVVSILPSAEFGPNDHQGDALRFTLFNLTWKYLGSRWLPYSHPFPIVVELGSIDVGTSIIPD